MATPYLMVGFRDSRYALEAVAVREIVWLPRLEPIVEQPPHVRGIFNLRGRVVPVIDLGVRFGYGPSPAAAEHRVVEGTTVNGAAARLTAAESRARQKRPRAGKTLRFIGVSDQGPGAKPSSVPASTRYWPVRVVPLRVL